MNRVRGEGATRDFKCQVCDRTYLSYPAMYTHMKNKHALDPNGATFAAQQPRGRGRPKAGADSGKVDPTSDLYMK